MTPLLPFVPESAENPRETENTRMSRDVMTTQTTRSGAVFGHQRMLRRRRVTGS